MEKEYIVDLFTCNGLDVHTCPFYVMLADEAPFQPISAYTTVPFVVDGGIADIILDGVIFRAHRDEQSESGTKIFFQPSAFPPGMNFNLDV